jgi:hypothetical protein
MDVDVLGSGAGSDGLLNRIIMFTDDMPTLTESEDDDILLSPAPAPALGATAALPSSLETSQPPVPASQPPVTASRYLCPFSSFQSHFDESSHLAFVLYVPDMGTLAAGSHKLRGSVPQSSTEAELEAVVWKIPSVIRVPGILVEWGMTQRATVIQKDNRSAILIFQMGPRRSKGTRPMRRRVFKDHFMVKDGEIELVAVPTELINADCLTKPKPRANFEPWVIWIQNVLKNVPRSSSPWGV